MKNRSEKSLRRALVTGATGGLGRHLVQKLKQAGYQIRASGRNRVIGQSLIDRNVEFVEGDLRQSGLVAALVKDCDVIFHCAALSSPWGKKEDFISMNVTVTQQLVDAALSEGVESFIHVSSPSLYFNFSDHLNISETEPFPPSFVNHYASTKAQSETVLQKAFTQGLKTVTIRPRGLFGEYDTVLIPRLLEVANKGVMPLLNQGKAIVDVTYAGNVADAMILCDRNCVEVQGEVFHISNNDPVSVQVLLKKVFAALKINVRFLPVPYHVVFGVAKVWETTSKILNLKTEPKLLPYSVGLLNYSQTLDISSAQKAIGYKPKVSIDEGLDRFATWYKGISEQKGGIR